MGNIPLNAAIKVKWLPDHSKRAIENGEMLFFFFATYCFYFRNFLLLLLLLTHIAHVSFGFPHEYK